LGELNRICEEQERRWLAAMSRFLEAEIRAGRDTVTALPHCSIRELDALHSQLPDPC
jgi:hypothetical protein